MSKKSTIATHPSDRSGHAGEPFREDEESGRELAIQDERSTGVLQQMRDELLQDDADLAEIYARGELSSQIRQLGADSATVLHVFLAHVYAVGWVIDRACPERRRILLKAMELRENEPKVFLGLLNRFWPVPGDPKQRKRIQTRHSLYAQALRGALTSEIKPPSLIEALKTQGGVDGLAETARRAKRALAKEAARRVLSSNASPEPTGKPRSSRGAERRPAERPPRHQASAEALSTRRRADAPLAARARTRRSISVNGSSRLLRRIKLQRGKIVAVIEVSRTGGEPTLEVVSFEPLPRHSCGEDVEALAEMIRAVRI